jgi:manganese transport protein
MVVDTGILVGRTRLGSINGSARKLLAFSGPGYLVAVGYMDPGNWATDIAGGAGFGYTLLSVVLLSNLMAILLQALSARLGIAAGRDLAEACREHYSPPVVIGLWILCEVAICACDLAEIIGTAIALKLLFGLPMILGICLTGLDTLVILLLPRHRYNWLEGFVVALLVMIAFCFTLEVIWAKPIFADVLGGLLPRGRYVTDPAMLYTAIGIMGATVMPHNLYLHSSLVQLRPFARTAEGKREAARYATLDSSVALTFAMLVNAAILIVAAATFHATGRPQVADIVSAQQLLVPVLGAPLAGVLFAVALLASGQNSTITGTMAGQIVMEGFLRIRLDPWLRRLLTRGLAIVPAALVSILCGDKGVSQLLVLSQVVLSLQLPFAVIPLIRFTSDHGTMGTLANPRWLTLLACAIAAIIVSLNATLLFDMIG